MPDSPEKKKNPNPTHQQIAMLFAVEPRTITKWVNELGMPKIGRGQYNLAECVQWRCNYLEKKITALENGGLDGINQGTRLKKANAQIRENQLARMQRELVSLDEITPIITQGLNNIRQLSASFAQRISPQVEGMELSERTEYIKEAINELFTELASIPNALKRFGSTAEFRSAEGFFDFAPPAKDEHKPTRRRKKNSQRIKRST